MQDGNYNKDEQEAKTSRRGCDIRRQIAKEFGLSRSTVREVIEAFIAGITQGIAEGEEVCVEGLGSFQARKIYQEAVVVCHPKGKARRVYKTKAQVRIRFHRSPKLGCILRDRWLTDEERGR